MMFERFWDFIKNTRNSHKNTTPEDAAENGKNSETAVFFLDEEISVLKFIKAYRSNTQFLSGTISAPIVGRWKRVRSFAYHFDEQPFRWKEQPRDEASESRLSWEFGSDGMIYYFTDNYILETDNYRYDCDSGRLVIDCSYTMVVQLTAENMICLSWDCSQNKCFFQDCYIRL